MMLNKIVELGFWETFSYFREKSLTFLRPKPWYPQLEILQIKDCATVALFCGENSTKSALDAIQILGGNGYINDYPTGQILLMEEE